MRYSASSCVFDHIQAESMQTLWFSVMKNLPEHVVLDRIYI